jgi:UrcA family protein
MRETIMKITTHLMLIGILVGANAFAGQPDDQVQKETVKFQELNVDTPAGVTALYQRIHSAARRVCNVGEDRNLGMQQQAKTCASEAEAGAIARVNSPALTAYYRIKTGKQVAVLAAN